jgi:hypothetical protein
MSMEPISTEKISFNYTQIFDAGELSSLKDLLADDSMSVFIQSNNPILLADATLHAVHGIRLCDMLEYKNDNFIDSTANTGDDTAIYIPLYSYPGHGRTVYYLDMQRLKYSYYNQLFVILDYLLKPHRLNLENRSFIIVNNIDYMLEEFINKFYIYIDKYNHSHYFMFVSSVASRRPIWNKLNTVTHRIRMNVTRGAARQVIDANYSVKAAIQGKLPLAKFNRLVDVLYNLFGGDLVKIDLVCGHALSAIYELPAGTPVTDKMIYELVILQIPAIKIIAGFIRSIRKIQSVNDLQLCYSTAFKLNAVNYTPAYVARIVTMYIGSSGMYQGDFHCLAKCRTEYLAMATNAETYTTRNDTDYIVVFQKYLIELARLCLTT